MTDIEAFIRARLDDDERMAVAAGGPGRIWTVLHRCIEDGFCDCSILEGGGGFRIRGDAGHSPGEAKHIARHDPDRVLREVAAWHIVIEPHQPCRSAHSHRDGIPCMGCDDLYPCHLLRTAATIWSDHTDYQPEWSPNVQPA